MTRMRWRLLGWLLATAVMLVVHVVLARSLASGDPIAEVLLGRGGSVVPLAGLLVVTRVVLVVLVPSILATSIVRVVLERFSGPDSD